MIRQRTVIVLGAGASVPYGFWSGQGLLDEARKYSAEEFSNVLPVRFGGEAPALHRALRGTLSSSIDAALETRPRLVDAGKAFMARWLLQCEQNWRDNQRLVEQSHPGQQWHELLWSACDLASLDAFRATPLTLITYNYDRSVEFALTRALQETFDAPPAECAQALDCIGPIHLHGQLGTLPQFPSAGDSVIPFGGMGNGVDEGDCLTAARGIKIIHEPEPTDEAFVRARDAIASAVRVIFLGFGYSARNVARLQLQKCMDRGVQLYLCTSGFSTQQVVAHVRPLFSDWGPRLQHGTENQDIVQFFRAFPEALL
jgi:hypothetical protein